MYFDSATAKPQPPDHSSLSLSWYRHTQVGQLEVKLTPLASLDGSGLAVDRVWPTNFIHRVSVWRRQNCQVGCHASSNTLRGQRDWNVGGAVVDGGLEDVGVGFAV